MIIDLSKKAMTTSSSLALKWFRCETDMEVVRSEIHEMEADSHNVQTNATRVTFEKIQIN